jgi:hypothetical protein
MLAAGSANVDLLSSCSNHRAQHGHVGDRVRGRTTPHEESHSSTEREGDQLFELVVTIDDRRPALDSGTAEQTQTIRELTGSVAGS